MAHAQRQPSEKPGSDAERFLDCANIDLMNARIDGLSTIEEVRSYLEYEHQNQCREGTLDRLKRRMREIR